MSDYKRGLNKGDPKLGELKEGQETAPFRARADRRALDAFRQLSTAEKGEVVEQWYRRRRVKLGS